MAQISYGTITITDTNDIESIVVEYNKNQSTTTPPPLSDTGWSTNRPSWQQGYYIWQRTRTHKAGTDVSTDTYGTAVCITGSTGQTGSTGRGITSIVTTYCNYGAGTPDASYIGWQPTVPVYDSTKPNYWVKTVVTYTTGSPATDTSIYKDNGLTESIAQSVEANETAAIANSIAQHASEDAQGAISQAAASQYQTEALAAKVKNYWWDSTGAHIASGINGAEVTEGTASTYGFNSLVGLSNITFGYNAIKTLELDGATPSLKFFKPSKTSQGDLAATLNSNGLILSEGGIEAGTKNTTNYIFVYSKDDATNHTLNINSSGNKSDWRIVAGNKFGVDKAGNLYASNVKVTGAITVSAGSNVYTNDEIDSQTTATEERFNSQDSQLSILGERTEELDSNYDNLLSDVNSLKPLNDYVSIQNDPARIDLVAGDNRLSLTTSEIQILIDNQLSSWFSGNTVFNKKIIAGEIYPRYITGNIDTKPNLTGGFGWIARSNGNLSLKIIRIGE